MQANNSPVQLYFEMPQYLYSQQKLLLCCGYSQFEFEQIQLWANEQLVGESKAIPRYLKDCVLKQPQEIMNMKSKLLK